MNPVDQGHGEDVLLSDQFGHPLVRFAALTIYYLGILVALVVLYGHGNFSTPPFIYQYF